MDKVLLNDGDWSLIANKECVVDRFTPLASLEESRIVKAGGAPHYALLHINNPNPSEQRSDSYVGAVAHKLDFMKLWWVFKVRGIAEDETAVIYWSKSELTPLAKLFSAFMPRMAITVFKSHSWRLLTESESEYRPDLTGEARALATGIPLLHSQPKMWERPLVASLEEF